MVAEVRAGARITLRSQPGGRALARLGDRTEFGSRQVLLVEAVRGGWLGVRSPEAGNGRLGWLRQSRSDLRLERTRLSVRVDRSKRRLELLAGH
ncbi:MAG: murein L,D-transpeptidase, partial [Actinomycetota bacterium]|nr:murein L,D-transpeptidase [Actinomycetota bacterium]